MAPRHVHGDPPQEARPLARQQRQAQGTAMTSGACQGPPGCPGCRPWLAGCARRPQLHLQARSAQNHLRSPDFRLSLATFLPSSIHFQRFSDRFLHVLRPLGLFSCSHLLHHLEPDTTPRCWPRRVFRGLSAHGDTGKPSRSRGLRLLRVLRSQGHRNVSAPRKNHQKPAKAAKNP